MYPILAGLNYFCDLRTELRPAESGHEAVAVCEGGREPGSVGEGGRGEGAAAGWLVVVRVVEVDTDWPLTSPSPDPGPGPLGCAVGEGDAEVILKRSQSLLFTC